jgi:hypothetical protein
VPPVSGLDDVPPDWRPAVARIAADIAARTGESAVAPIVAALARLLAEGEAQGLTDALQRLSDQDYGAASPLLEAAAEALPDGAD